MDHHNILEPYRKSNKYYNGHYVCLWQVTEREIVGHWQWDDLVALEDWYQAIVMPAFRLLSRNPVPMALQNESVDLSDVMNKLFRRFLI